MAAEYRYHKVSPRFWSDRKVLAWDDDTRMLALYLLTCEHRTTEGLFRLPEAYIAADLGWTMERLAEPFAKLLDDGFIKYDSTVSVMLLINALKWNPTDNPNQAKAILKSIDELPETPLLRDFQRLAERFDKRLAERLAERYGKPPTPTPTPTPTPLTDNEGAQREKERATTLSDTPASQSVGLGGDVTDGHPTPTDAMSWPDVTERYHATLGMLGPTQFGKLQAWHEDNRVSAGVLVAAIDIAAQAKAEGRIRGHPFNYLDGVIRGMVNDGIKTVADLHAKEGPQTEDEWIAFIMAQAAKAEGG